MFATGPTVEGTLPVGGQTRGRHDCLHDTVTRIMHNTAPPVTLVDVRCLHLPTSTLLTQGVLQGIVKGACSVPRCLPIEGKWEVVRIAGCRP